MGGHVGKKIFKNRFDTFVPKKIDFVLNYFRYVIMLAYAFFATSFFTSKILAKLGGPDTGALVNIVFSRKMETVYDRYCISCFQWIGYKGCPKKGALYLDMHPINIFKREK